jgi:hypothetical protein
LELLIAARNPSKETVKVHDDTGDQVILEERRAALGISVNASRVRLRDRHVGLALILRHLWVGLLVLYAGFWEEMLVDQSWELMLWNTGTSLQLSAGRESVGRLVESQSTDVLSLYDV